MPRLPSRGDDCNYQNCNFQACFVFSMCNLKVLAEFSHDVQRKFKYTDLKSLVWSQFAYLNGVLITDYHKESKIRRISSFCHEYERFGRWDCEEHHPGRNQERQHPQHALLRDERPGICLKTGSTTPAVSGDDLLVCAREVNGELHIVDEVGESLICEFARESTVVMSPICAAFGTIAG